MIPVQIYSDVDVYYVSVLKRPTGKTMNTALYSPRSVENGSLVRYAVNDDVIDACVECY